MPPPSPAVAVLSEIVVRSTVTRPPVLSKLCQMPPPVWAELLEMELSRTVRLPRATPMPPPSIAVLFAMVVPSTVTEAPPWTTMPPPVWPAVLLNIPAEINDRSDGAI